MIISTLLNALCGLIKVLFGWINIPSFPEEIMTYYSYIINLLNVGKTLIDLFLPWNLVRFGLPLIIIVINFEYVYKFIMWILRKIPMLGIE